MLKVFEVYKARSSYKARSTKHIFYLQLNESQVDYKLPMKIAGRRRILHWVHKNGEWQVEELRVEDVKVQLGSKSGDCGELWSAYAEKAYAQVRFKAFSKGFDGVLSVNIA